MHMRFRAPMVLFMPRYLHKYEVRRKEPPKTGACSLGDLRDGVRRAARLHRRRHDVLRHL